MLEILRAFLMSLGGFGALWGFYDMFGGDGQQNSVGVKKIIGGIAFGALSYFIVTNNINSISSAESQAGVTGALYLPFLIHSVAGRIGW